MVILIAGASHTGKTVLAQKLLERYKMPYLSIDHLKMGLIRSGYTSLTPEDDDKLVAYLWPIVREMIKTAIENKQNLIVEGCYIPFDYKNDFDESYLKHIRFYCLIMSESYIKTHFSDIRYHACEIEARMEDDLRPEDMIKDNIENLRLCKENGCEYILIDEKYDAEIPEIEL